MNDNIQLKQHIMRRVHTVHLMRQLLSPLRIKIAAFVFLFAAEIVSVSVSNVLTNWFRSTKDFSTAYNFIVSAFMNTGHLVQIVSLALILLFAFFARDIYKTVAISQRAQVTV